MDQPPPPTSHSPSTSPAPPTNPSAPSPSPGNTPGLPTSDERTIGMLCHLMALAGYIIPFGNIIGPLIVWLVKKDTSRYVDYHGKESLNFQITVTLALLLCIPLLFVCIGIPLMIAVGIAALVFMIIAAVKASAGEHYRYPFALRMIN